MGVCCSTIWNWENGKSKPELRYLSAIIEFLGYNPLAPPTSLSERLIYQRRLRGWTQDRMARLLGVDVTTLARWERGKRQPTRESLVSIRELLGDAKDCPTGCASRERYTAAISPSDIRS